MATNRTNRDGGTAPGWAVGTATADIAPDPETTAVFVIGCAGDRKTDPKGMCELAEERARTAATAVERALVGQSRPVRGPLKLAAGETALEIENPVDDGGSGERDGSESGHGTETTDGVDKTVTDRRPHPIQAIGFGADLMILSPGEVVADFAVRLKEALASPRRVAAYANNTGYLPAKRILAEGGDESGQSFEDGLYAPTTDERTLPNAPAPAERVGAQRRDP